MKKVYIEAAFAILLEGARTETDPEARMQIYAKALAIIREYVPILTLLQSEVFLPVDPRITNFELSPTGIHNIGTIRFVDHATMISGASSNHL